MDSGRLLNLAALVRGGAWGPMRSTVAPITPPAWTTMMTGKNTGKHGVFDFLPMDGGDASVPLASRRRATEIWRALSDRGYRVGTLSLPGTYPPERLSAFQVSGFDAPSFSPAAVSSPEVYEALRTLAGETVWFSPPPWDAVQECRAHQSHAGLVVAATDRLLQSFPCDVYMANFQIADWAQHAHLAQEMLPTDVSSLAHMGSWPGRTASWTGSSGRR